MHVSMNLLHVNYNIAFELESMHPRVNIQTGSGSGTFGATRLLLALERLHNDILLAKLARRLHRPWC